MHFILRDGDGLYLRYEVLLYLSGRVTSEQQNIAFLWLERRRTGSMNFQFLTIVLDFSPHSVGHKNLAQREWGSSRAESDDPRGQHEGSYQSVETWLPRELPLSRDPHGLSAAQRCSITTLPTTSLAASAAKAAGASAKPKRAPITGFTPLAA